ncbi:MAG TPA: stage V sporulation protein AD [Syntrophomonas sp.]|nr:stage V sporulation protein AD [Syntrophomonas sp.]
MTAAKKMGFQTVRFPSPPVVCAWASIVGPKEGQGPWSQDFDKILDDYLYAEKSWEKAENKILQYAVHTAVAKVGLDVSEVELLLAGDLLNQIISANYAARELSIPFLGLYGACSTMAESLLLASMLIEAGYFERVVAATCSHHFTAERQYRAPVEQGIQPSLSSQWTATAAGAVLVQPEGSGPRITHATIGKVIDMGITDSANMGAAMAPAAGSTIKAHFEDTGRPYDYYDLVVTGDLGMVGMNLLKQIFVQQGMEPTPTYSDCGVMIYDGLPDVKSGASGCGCSAAMLCGPLLRKMSRGEINRLLFVPTGALMSPTSSFQGESIPGIAHALAIENV